MRITKDNIEAVYFNCSRLGRYAAHKNDAEVIKHAEAALVVLGFKKVNDSNTELDRTKVNEFVSFWHDVSRYFYTWLDLQDTSRDWYVNSQIRRARVKISASLKELQIKLLDIVESSGKVYDK